MTDQTRLEILIAEDNTSVRTVAKAMVSAVLDKNGLDYNIDEAVDGQEALDAISKKPYNLILSDHLMPGVNGAILYSHLDEGQRRKTVMLPGDAGLLKKDLIELGITEFPFVVQKPVDLEHYEQIVAAYLSPASQQP